MFRTLAIALSLIVVFSLTNAQELKAKTPKECIEEFAKHCEKEDFEKWLST